MTTKSSAQGRYKEKRESLDYSVFPLSIVTKAAALVEVAFFGIKRIPWGFKLRRIEKLAVALNPGATREAADDAALLQNKELTDNRIKDRAHKAVHISRGIGAEFPKRGITPYDWKIFRNTFPDYSVNLNLPKAVLDAVNELEQQYQMTELVENTLGDSGIMDGEQVRGTAKVRHSGSKSRGTLSSTIFRKNADAHKTSVKSSTPTTEAYIKVRSKAGAQPSETQAQPVVSQLRVQLENPQGEVTTINVPVGYTITLGA